MALLPLFKTNDRILSQLQTQWAAILNVLIGNPSLQCNILSNVSLKNGVTVINHLLGRTQQGWRIVDINGSASIYRSQPFNDKTLTLTSNAAVTVSLEVF